MRALKKTFNRVAARGLMRVERHYLSIIGKRYVRSRYGVLMRANWEDSTFNYCYFGAYGNVLSDFLNSIDYEFVFLDIGANQGLFSLLAAQNPKCAKSIAFEPVHHTFELLEQNVDANKLEKKVTPVNAAISSTTGCSEIFVKSSHSGAASLLEIKEAGEEKTENIRTIDIKDTDKLIPTNARIIVKIDVEGHEDVVINELLKSENVKAIQAVFYEMDEELNDPAVLKGLLEKGGFAKFEKFGSGSHYDVLALR